MINYKEKQNCLPFILFFFLVFFSTIPTPGQAEDNGAKGTIAVLPFEMHAPGSMAYLQDGLRDMLASRLSTNAGAKVIDRNQINNLLPEPSAVLQDQQALDLGSQLGADYVITGSLTSLGTSMSLDAKVFSVTATQEPMSFYASATQDSELINAINQLSWDIAEKVFDKKRPASAIQTTSIQPAVKEEETVTEPYITAHPDKAFKADTGTGVVPLIMPQTVAGGINFTKTQNVEYVIYGMDVGDVDGDGQLDIVMAKRDAVFMYHLVNSRLQEFGSVKMPARSSIHSISVADTDMNGKAEIYVSACDETTPHSWAYEWNGKDFDIILDDVPWYIRTVKLPGEGLTLVGQRGGNDSVLRAGIFRLMRSGKRLQPQERLVMPNYVNLFDFVMADVTGDGNIEIVGISIADRIYVVRRDGRQLWVSDNYYSGTRRFIGEAFEQKKVAQFEYNIDTAPSYEVIGKEDSGKRIYIPSRMIVMDINKDGKDDIIVNRNVSTASRVMQNFKRYKSGEVHALTWNGIGMTEIWKTKKIDGYIPDFQFLSMPDKDNAAQLYVGLVLRTSGWSSALIDGDSTLLMYDLELATEKAENQAPQK
jgi:TolB-like protein